MRMYELSTGYGSRLVIDKSDSSGVESRDDDRPHQRGAVERQRRVHEFCSILIIIYTNNSK